MKFTTETIERLISNPFYAIDINPVFIQEHPKMVTKKEWIKANIKLMDEIGAERWLENLLENLTGNYIISGEE